MLKRKISVKFVKVKLLKDIKHFSVWQLIIFILVFAGIGGYAIYRSFADTGSVVIAADDFNRADSNPVSGNWESAPGSYPMQILSGQLANTNDTQASSCSTVTANGALWKDVLPADLDVEVTVAAKGAAHEPVIISLYDQAMNGQVTMAIYPVDETIYLNGVTDPILYTYPSFPVNVGDRIGLRISGTTVEAMHNGEVYYTRTIPSSSVNLRRVQIGSHIECFNPAGPLRIDDFSVTSVGATGELGSWVSANSLPAARAEGVAVTVNGYAYLIGGCDSYSDANCKNATHETSTVYYAKYSTDGSLGAWQTNANNLPQGLTAAAAVTANGYIYVIGGRHVSATSNVYYAKVNTDGSTGAWQTNTNPLPYVVMAASAQVASGYLYVVGGEDDPFGAGIPKNTVIYAKLNSDGSTGTWTTSSSLMPVAITQLATAVQNGYLYSIGGWNGSGYASDVYYSKLNADGSLGVWTTSPNSLPAAKNHITAVVNNGYVYIMGGESAFSVQSSVHYAKLNADGTVSSWTTGTSLPSGRAVYGAVTDNGYLYLIGGASCIIFAGPGCELSSVVYSQTQMLNAIAAPSGLTAKPVSDTEIDLSWKASTSSIGIAGYKVYENVAAVPGPGEGDTVIPFGMYIGTTTSTSYQVTNLQAATSYSFYVVAVDTAGNISSQSNYASTVTGGVITPCASNKTTRCLQGTSWPYLSPFGDNNCSSANSSQCRPMTLQTCTTDNGKATTPSLWSSAMDSGVDYGIHSIQPNCTYDNPNPADTNPILINGTAATNPNSTKTRVYAMYDGKIICVAGNKGFGETTSLPQTCPGGDASFAGPEGTWLVYQLTSGPAKGMNIYVAEGCTLSSNAIKNARAIKDSDKYLGRMWSDGRLVINGKKIPADKVTANSVLCEISNRTIETGWANEDTQYILDSSGKTLGNINNALVPAGYTCYNYILMPSVGHVTTVWGHSFNEFIEQSGGLSGLRLKKLASGDLVFDSVYHSCDKYPMLSKYANPAWYDADRL